MAFKDGYYQTITPEQYLEAERQRRERRMAEQSKDSELQRRMDDLLARVSDRHKAEADGALLPTETIDEEWSDARAETLKYKLAQAQQRAEQEWREQEAIASHARALRLEHERIENQYRTWTTNSVGGGLAGGSYFNPAPPPEPKKPVEIPILTFGKRRINLKDVA